MASSPFHRDLRDPVHLHCNPNGHHPLVLFVADFNGDLSRMATREPIPSDLDGCDGGFALGALYILELEALTVARAAL